MLVGKDKLEPGDMDLIRVVVTPNGYLSTQLETVVLEVSVTYPSETKMSPQTFRMETLREDSPEGRIVSACILIDIGAAILPLKIDSAVRSVVGIL